MLPPNALFKHRPKKCARTMEFIVNPDAQHGVDAIIVDRVSAIEIKGRRLPEEGMAKCVEQGQTRRMLR